MRGSTAPEGNVSVLLQLHVLHEASNDNFRFAMGYYTEVGIGCPRSLEEAKRWYGRAACKFIYCQPEYVCIGSLTGLFLSIQFPQGA